MDDKAVLRKLQKIYNFVIKSRRSTFYRKKYLGSNSPKLIKSFADFHKIPLLQKTELLGVDPFDRLYTPESRVGKITIGSGTTNVNKPLITFLGKYDNYKRKIFVKLFKKLGIKRVLFLRPPMRIDSFWLHSVPDDLQFIMGDTYDFPATIQLISRVGVDAICSIPTILARFIPQFEKAYDLKKIKWVELRGEYCTRQTYIELKNKFPKALIQYRYGASEIGFSTSQCANLANIGPEVFHPLRVFYFEIINPESGQPLGYDKEGEIVVTHLSFEPMPLIRYRTGDLGVLRQKKCPCGEELLLEVGGRAQFDRCKVAGVIIHAQRVQDAVSSAQDVVDQDFRLHVFERKEQGEVLPYLEIEVIPKKEDRRSDFKALLAQKISQNLFLTPNLTLANFVQKGLFLPLGVKIVKSFPRDIKRKYIVSHLN